MWRTSKTKSLSHHHCHVYPHALLYATRLTKCFSLLATDGHCRLGCSMLKCIIKPSTSAFTTANLSCATLMLCNNPYSIATRMWPYAALQQDQQDHQRGLHWLGAAATAGST